jgi:DNA-binding NarL/FixJ family response regulator
MTLEEAIHHALSEEEGVGPSSPTPEQTRSEQPAALTCREEEVAALVTQGMSNRQIASELHLSECTVENHVSKILRKLRLASRAEIAAWAPTKGSSPPTQIRKPPERSWLPVRFGHGLSSESRK